MQAASPNADQPRFEQIEVLGPPRRLYSNFIHGIRSLPVRIPG